MTLRKAMLWRALALTALMLGACVALVVLTTLLRRTTDEVYRIVQARSLAGELSSEVLSHAIESSPDAAALVEARGRELTDHIDTLSRTPAERQAFAVLMPLLHRAWTDPDHAQALRHDIVIALERLRGVTNDEAIAVQQRAHDLDSHANMIGVLLVGLLGAAFAFSIWWLNHFVSTPIDSIARSVDRFADGDLDVRAPEHGVVELRKIAHTYNEMADAVARTRLDQLQYLATVIHDLRSPIAALQLAAGYISPDRPLPPEQRVRQLFDIVNRQLARLNSVVGDVLNAIQVDAGSLVLRREPCRADEIARTCVTRFEALAPAHRFELEIAGPMELVADAHRIEQVIDNLISNAIKYSPAGTLVTVAVHGEDAAVRIAVTDRGSGVAPEVREHLFRPFWRGATMHEEVPGVGLGLYVTRKIVEAHGGTLEVESKLGKGSTFTATLPRTPDRGHP